MSRSLARPIGTLRGGRTVGAALARRAPFTLATIGAIVLVAVITGTASAPIDRLLLDRWGFGLADLRAGRFLNLAAAPFQILRPAILVTVTSSLFVFGVACEILWGTRRTALAFWVSHAVGYVGTLLLLWGLGAAGWDWARNLSQHQDVGASNGVFGAAGALAAGLPRRWGRPLTLVLAAFLLFRLFTSQEIWDVQHTLGFGSGLLLGGWFVVRRGDPWPYLLPSFQPDARQKAQFLSWGLGMLGCLNVATAFVVSHHPGFETLETYLTLPHASRHLLLVAGVSMILLARGLARRGRSAWWGAAAALAVTVLLQALLGPHHLGAVWAGLLMVPMISWRAAFTAPPAAPSLRQGLLGLGRVAIGVPLYGLLGFFTLRHDFPGGFHLGQALVETGRRILFLEGPEPGGITAAWFVRSIPLLAWGGTLLALTQILRGALAPRPGIEDEERAWPLLLTHGGSGTAYMTLWPGNSLFFAPPREGYVAYRVNAGVAVALGDPVGPPAKLDAAITAFAGFCGRHGWDPAFYAAGAPHVPAYRRAGFRLLQIGEEAVIPLDGLAFRGKDWQDVRSAMNRAGREGMSFHMFEGGTVPPELRDQMTALGEAWLSEKGLPAMEFTLGRTTDVDDPNIQVAVAVDARGKLLAFADWLPVYARRGWVIDLMRRDPDAMGGAMEFLIGMSLLTFQERGYGQASLAAAPLADVDRDAGASLVQRALGAVYDHSETFYNFKSLFRFKEKFHPRWEPVYLAHTGVARLPRVALSILRAHLPSLDLPRVTTLLGESVAEFLRQEPDASPPPE